MMSAPIQSMLDEALRQHQAGALDRAALLYRQILEADPANAGALHLLSTIALQTGQAQSAAELSRKAIAIRGQEASYHFNLALALQTMDDMEGAVTSYRRALILKPNSPDTYNNMGNALAALGKLDEAASAFRRIIVLQPENAVAHNNLGNVQRSMGQLDEAEDSYTKAMNLQRGYVGAIVNLGNIRRDKGNLKEAEDSYRRAVSLVPEHTAARCNLGLTLWNLGERDEALACYREVLARDPDHVETLVNLAIARWESGALEEAEAIYIRVLNLRPRDPDLINNFASLLMARGNSAGAMEMIRRSLAIRETRKAKRLFVDLARQSGWSGNNENIRSMMVRALCEPWDRPGKLGRASAELIKSNPAIGPLVMRANAAWPGQLSVLELLGEAGFMPLAQDEVLIALLTSAPNTDISLERFLTMVRGAMVRQLTQDGSLDPGAEIFASALAQQCFINEYVFFSDDAEMAVAATIGAALGTLIAITPMQLLMAAAYFPLHSIAGLEKLLERSWSASVDQVLAQQLREPLEERRLCAEIPRLTKIEDKVSQRVQNQYEQNPYPRWIRLAAGVPDNIVSFLSGKFRLPVSNVTRDGR